MEERTVLNESFSDIMEIFLDRKDNARCISTLKEGIILTEKILRDDLNLLKNMLTKNTSNEKLRTFEEFCIMAEKLGFSFSHIKVYDHYFHISRQLTDARQFRDDHYKLEELGNFFYENPRRENFLKRTSNFKTYSEELGFDEIYFDFHTDNKVILKYGVYLPISEEQYNLYNNELGIVNSKIVKK